MFWKKTIKMQKKDINYLEYKIKILEKQFEIYEPIITNLEKQINKKGKIKWTKHLLQSG